MPSEPPPAYDVTSGLFNAPYSNFQNLNYETATAQTFESDKYRNQTVLPPTVPPGGIETQNFGVSFAFHSAPSQPSFMYPVPSAGYYGPGSIPPPPPFSRILPGSCQTPNGGRYWINRRGFIEHITEAQYNSRRVMQSIVAVFICIIMILFLVFTLKSMASFSHG